MFGIGGSELLVIALVALLVFGPGRIPEVLRVISNGYRELAKLRRQVDDTVSELKQDLNLNLDPLDIRGRRPLPVSRSQPASTPKDSAPAAAPQSMPEKGSLDDYLAERGKGAAADGDAVSVDEPVPETEPDGDAVAVEPPADDAGVDDYLGEDSGR